MPRSSSDDSVFVGGTMPTLLLTFFLLLSANHSCERGTNKNTPSGSSQIDTAQVATLLDEVNAGDEAALRVFLRLKIAAYLWKNPSAKVDPDSLVKATRAALDELTLHGKEIPPLYVDLFRRELTAQLQVHAPASDGLQSQAPGSKRRSDLEVAYSMLGQEKGIDKAVGIVQQSIASGKDPGRLIVPFLHRLEQVSPAKVSPVLETVVAVEETRPGAISTGMLFTLKHLFIRDKTLPELQRRYLAIVVGRAGDTEATLASAVDLYTILSDVLPVIQAQSPSLYEEAKLRLDELSERVPSGTRERIAIDKRVSQSSDPLAQLLAESNTASDASVRDDLRIAAAQLALEKGQIETAIGLVAKIQPANNGARLWRDQFMESAVQRAIDSGDVTVAKYGAGLIQSPAIRSSALQKVALSLQASNDVMGARDTLHAAVKLTEAAGNDADKAVALLDLAVSYLKVDERRALELAKAAVNVINKTSAIPQAAAVGSDEQLHNTDDLLKIAYKLIPAFQAFGAANESAASGLASELQRPEFKTAATFGTYTSQSVADKNTAGLASKK
jgi:hypothetical protein